VGSSQNSRRAFEPGLGCFRAHQSRYLSRVGRREYARKLWLVFLRNHREVIAAMDFFTVSTATFRVLTVSS
jgi:hypothetical protein